MLTRQRNNGTDFWLPPNKSQCKDLFAYIYFVLKWEILYFCQIMWPNFLHIVLVCTLSLFKVCPFFKSLCMSAYRCIISEVNLYRHCHKSSKFLRYRKPLIRFSSMYLPFHWDFLLFFLRRKKKNLDLIFSVHQLGY